MNHNWALTIQQTLGLWLPSLMQGNLQTEVKNLKREWKFKTRMIRLPQQIPKTNLIKMMMSPWMKGETATLSNHKTKIKTRIHKTMIIKIKNVKNITHVITMMVRLLIIKLLERQEKCLRMKNVVQMSQRRSWSSRMNSMNITQTLWWLYSTFMPGSSQTS